MTKLEVIRKKGGDGGRKEKGEEREETGKKETNGRHGRDVIQKVNFQERERMRSLFAPNRREQWSCSLQRSPSRVMDWRFRDTPQNLDY